MYDTQLPTWKNERFGYLVRSVDVVGPDEAVVASLDSTLVRSTPHPNDTSRQELRVTATFCRACRAEPKTWNQAVRSSPARSWAA